MSKLGNAAKTGATWGVAGTALGGPYVGAAAALGGGIYGWLSDTSDEQADAEKQKLAGMQGAANIYQGYRPQVMGARQQGLQQNLSAYNGAGNAMGLMYGNSYNPANYAPDLGKLPDPQSYTPAVAPKPAEPEKPPEDTSQAWYNTGSRKRTGPSNGADGYDAEKTKALQNRLGRTDVWVDAAGGVHTVGGTNAGIVSPF